MPPYTRRSVSLSRSLSISRVDDVARCICRGYLEHVIQAALARAVALAEEDVVREGAADVLHVAAHLDIESSL